MAPVATASVATGSAPAPATFLLGVDAVLGAVALGAPEPLDDRVVRRMEGEDVDLAVLRVELEQLPLGEAAGAAPPGREGAHEVPDAQGRAVDVGLHRRQGDDLVRLEEDRGHRERGVAEAAGAGHVEALLGVRVGQAGHAQPLEGAAGHVPAAEGGVVEVGRVDDGGHLHGGELLQDLLVGEVVELGIGDRPAVVGGVGGEPGGAPLRGDWEPPSTMVILSGPTWRTR